MSSNVHHCADFTRSALLHKACAQAGEGLPMIERGMPLPAGTGLDRRKFLSRAAGAALAVYGASKLPIELFQEGVAGASTGPGGPVLVSVFLPGGADSLTMLSPVGDPAYLRLRPKLAVAGAKTLPFAGDNRLHWHPSLAPLAQLSAEGKVAVAPAIGYSKADQSHFTSRHYWEVGATEASRKTGWMGRYLDATGTMDNPLQGLSLGYTLAPSLAPTRVPVASFDTADRYSVDLAGDTWGARDRILDALGDFGSGYGDPAQAAAGLIAAQANTLGRQLTAFKSGTVPVTYPTVSDPFPRRLAELAGLIAAGLPLRCVAISASGDFDTHSGQVGQLEPALGLTAQSLLAFQRDLEARGIADRVLIHVWSEFGRRAAENASGGTDHGAAGTSFVIGSRVRGGIIGEFPGLSNGLDSLGNLLMTTDFRGLYAAILEQWFNFDAALVIPNASSFARPAVVR